MTNIVIKPHSATTSEDQSMLALISTLFFPLLIEVWSTTHLTASEFKREKQKPTFFLVEVRERT